MKTFKASNSAHNPTAHGEARCPVEKLPMFRVIAPAVFGQAVSANASLDTTSLLQSAPLAVLQS